MLNSIYFIFATFFLSNFLCAGVDTGTFYKQSSIEEIETKRQVDHLLLLMQKRLSIMHEISKSKWNGNMALEDRDDKISKTLSSKSKELSLDDSWVSNFFLYQNQAAQEIQKSNFNYWNEIGVLQFSTVLDLENELLPYIERIDLEMIDLISLIFNKYQESLNSRYVLMRPISTRSTDGIEQNIWEIAISPFGN